VNGGMKVFVERGEERAMKVPNIDEVGENGSEICTVEERLWRIKGGNNRCKE
jgi:hypothetical protein